MSIFIEIYNQQAFIFSISLGNRINDIKLYWKFVSNEIAYFIDYIAFRWNTYT